MWHALCNWHIYFWSPAISQAILLLQIDQKIECSSNEESLWKQKIIFFWQIVVCFHYLIIYFLLLLLISSLLYSTFFLYAFYLAEEAERIWKCKGRIFALQNEPEVSRVWLPNHNSPGLAMARAFGDFCLKDFGLISVPDITYRRITEKDEFIVLATDGVWQKA